MGQDGQGLTKAEFAGSTVRGQPLSRAPAALFFGGSAALLRRRGPATTVDPLSIGSARRANQKARTVYHPSARDGAYLSPTENAPAPSSPGALASPPVHPQPNRRWRTCRDRIDLKRPRPRCAVPLTSGCRGRKCNASKHLKCICHHKNTPASSGARQRGCRPHLGSRCGGARQRSCAGSKRGISRLRIFSGSLRKPPVRTAITSSALACW